MNKGIVDIRCVLEPNEDRVFVYLEQAGDDEVLLGTLPAESAPGGIVLQAWVYQRVRLLGITLKGHLISQRYGITVLRPLASAVMS